MRKAKIFFIAGLIMMVISGGILYWQTAKKSKAATKSFTETWNMTQARRLLAKGTPPLGCTAGNLMAAVMIGPAQWQTCGCLDQVAGTCSPCDYSVTYTGKEWTSYPSYEGYNDWRIEFDSNTDSSAYNPCLLLSTFTTSGLYNGGMRLVYPHGSWDGGGTSWPKKWEITGTYND